MHRSVRRSIKNSRPLKFEWLEIRQVLSANAAHLVSPNLSQIVVPNAGTTTAPAGLSPAQVRAAYGFNGITFGGVAGDGRNQIIAIVDAFNDPNIVADLTTFDAQFGLAAPPSFKVVGQTGGTKLPKNDRGWASEIALDVEWAHAIAPGANILLVEATSDYDSDLNAALDYARKATGVVVVSNSWGGSEYSSEKSDDVHFTTPSGHAGVTFTVAAGDDGAPAEYPSSSPDVLSVGGSTLRLSSTGAWSSETVWSGGGGGSSRYEGLPSFQNGTGVANRGTPDVSYDANPNTGFAIYDSYGDTGWDVFGGTSAGAPQWAALIAIADQGRAAAGKSSLGNAQAALYTLPRSDFHDITSGSNGASAASGYDVASGLGSPIANLVIRDLVAFSGSTSFTQAAAKSTTTRNRGGFPWGFFVGFEESAGGSTASAPVNGSAFGAVTESAQFNVDITAAGDQVAIAPASLPMPAPLQIADSLDGAFGDVHGGQLAKLHAAHHSLAEVGTLDSLFAKLDRADSI